jgi:hypothetical protein
MSLYTKARAMLVTVMVVAALTGVPARGYAQAPGFRNTGDMTFARFSYAAVVLADGTVLVVSDFSAERYDPAANTFTLIAFSQSKSRTWADRDPSLRWPSPRGRRSDRRPVSS